MDPTNKPLRIELDDHPMDLYFDFWTIQKFETETKRNYMNWIATMASHSQMIALELQMMGTDEPERKRISEKRDAGETLTEEELRKLADFAAESDVDKMRFAQIVGDVMSVGDFVSIIFAAYHTPGKTPRWLSTIESLAPVCDQEAFYRWSIPIMQAACKSVQRRKKPDDPVEEDRPMNPSPVTAPNGGGKTSGDSDDGILDSLTKKSAN